MVARLLGVGVALLTALLLAGVAMTMRFDARKSTPAAVGASVLARTLTKGAQERNRAPIVGWVVKKATSAHHAMVVDVDAERLEEARGIAVQIVEPVRTHGYDEILIYVRQPGRREPLVRRIQWTPRGGYAVTTYSDQ